MDNNKDLVTDTSDVFARQEGSIKYHVTEDILSDSKAIIDSSQRIARRAVNVSLVLRNWFLGKRIVEEELRGATRSELYGRELIVKLADELNAECGKGFGKSNLYQYVKFYRLFPEIFHGNRGKSPSLTWTHYRHLLRVEDPEARAWYEHRNSKVSSSPIFSSSCWSSARAMRSSPASST